MGENKVEVNTGGGSLNMVGSAIGIGNTIQGNTYGISDSLNISEPSNRQELLTVLQQLRDELQKARDLPEDQADDLKGNLDAAIKATDRDKPNKDRVVEKLTTMQKLLDGLKDNVGSALALGNLVGQVLVVALGLRF